MAASLTVGELAGLLNLSESVIRIHLGCLDKYKVPHSKPLSYYYNTPFLYDLKEFYIEKSSSIGRRYKRYQKTVQKIDKLINLLKT